MHPGYGRAVSVPEDFRVGIPNSFEHQIGRSGARGEESRRPDGVWLEVEGGGIPVPLLVRIDQASNGRFLVTGLMIGRDEHRELTWSTLREIKPASILSMLFTGWDPRLPEKIVDDRVDAQQPRDPAVDDEVAQAFARSNQGDPHAFDNLSTEARAAYRETVDFLRPLAAAAVWRMTGGAERARSGGEVTEVTRPRASVATNLTDFADVYRRNFAADPRRATSATANEMHISRATAIRRIAECRELGLIPPKEQGRE